MAEGHWQVVHRNDEGSVRYGRVEPIPLDMVPPSVLRVAVRASKLMGNGLYGVDLKQVGRRCVVIEVNDNPNIDSGFEDKILGDELYRRIMRGFLRRVERKKEGAR
jgi:glutathione synthase/RimK-type ligase-like ATP-grasp enzyme